jgi:hypothetical protein
VAGLKREAHLRTLDLAIHLLSKLHFLMDARVISREDALRAFAHA